jgi:hypothetical protein
MCYPGDLAEQVEAPPAIGHQRRARERAAGILTERAITGRVIIGTRLGVS